MSQECATRFLKAVQEDQELQAKFKAIDDPETFVKMAAQRGYDFTVEDLENQIARMSHEEVAAVINPGVGTRRHILPR
jgi:predicted ribosomally synthesized peptide with nif11-like leader